MKDSFYGNHPVFGTDKNMIEQCFICCQDNPKNVVSCNICQNKKDGIKLITCLQCVKKYLLEESNDANCMLCKNVWSISFLYSIFPKSFINNEYRKHLAKIYLEREKALIPSTIPLANHVKDRKARLERTRKEVEEKTLLVKHLMAELESAEEELSKTKRELGKIMAEPYLPSNSETIIKNAPIYLLPCPSANCRGLVEKKTKCCPICETRVCKSCLEIITKNNDHTCDKEKLVSASEIKNNTKPCPKCATRIYKYEGCDLMWCTQCQTPFSWEKGTIVNTTKIHNPHYFDWLHQMALQKNAPSTTQQTLTPKGCENNRLIDFQQMLFPLIERFKYGDKRFDQIKTEHRDLSALLYDEIPRLKSDKKRVENDATLRNRVQFILGESSEESLKRMVVASQRKKHKYAIILQILEAYCEMVNERLNNIYNGLNQLSDEEIEICLNETQSIRDLANQSLKREIFELMGYECYPMIHRGLTYVRESKEHE